MKKKVIAPMLEDLNAWFFMPVSNGMGKHGIPDFIACVPQRITADMVGQTIGRFVGIEAKAPDRKRNVSDHQTKQLTAIRNAHGIAAVVWDEQSMYDQVVYHFGGIREGED